MMLTLQKYYLSSSPKIVDSNKDAKLPELKPLPPLFALGDPPKKPPKFGLLKPSLKKYLGMYCWFLSSILTECRQSNFDIIASNS